MKITIEELCSEFFLPKEGCTLHVLMSGLWTDFHIPLLSVTIPTSICTSLLLISNCKRFFTFEFDFLLILISFHFICKVMLYTVC